MCGSHRRPGRVVLFNRSHCKFTAFQAGTCTENQSSVRCPTMKPAESHSYASVVPKFDLAQAKRLFLKGRSVQDLAAAAERLGDQELKAHILKFEKERAQHATHCKEGPRLAKVCVYEYDSA